MGWPSAAKAKVAWGVDKAGAKVMVPEPIDDHPRRERIGWIGHPRSEGQPSFFVSCLGPAKFSGKPGHRQAAGRAPGATDCRPVACPQAVDHPGKAAVIDKTIRQPLEAFCQWPLFGWRLFGGNCGVRSVHGSIVKGDGPNGLSPDWPAG